MSSVFPVTHSTLSAKALLIEVLPEYDIDTPTACKLLRLGLNDTYLVQTHDGEQYILRIYRATWRSLSDILYEMDVLTHLQRKGVAVSIPVPRKDGSCIRTLPAPEGTRYAALFTYAPGKEPSYDMESHAWHYGKTVARIHTAMEDFTSLHPRFSLDFAHLIETPLKAIQPCLSYRANDWEYLQKLGDNLQRHLIALPIHALVQGFCHGDFHGGNAHVADDNTVTCFDFDCCGWGWHAYDIAVFRWGARLRRKAKEQWEPFLQGYTAERHLHRADLQGVPCFVGVRHLWFMGLHTENGHDWGFGWINDRYFDRAVKFLRDWEGEYLMDQKEAPT